MRNRRTVHRLRGGHHVHQRPRQHGQAHCRPQERDAAQPVGARPGWNRGEQGRPGERIGATEVAHPLPFDHELRRISVRPGARRHSEEAAVVNEQLQLGRRARYPPETQRWWRDHPQQRRRRRHSHFPSGNNHVSRTDANFAYEGNQLPRPKQRKKQAVIASKPSETSIPPPPECDDTA